MNKILNKRNIYLISRSLNLLRTNPKVLISKLIQKINASKNKIQFLNLQKIKLVNSETIESNLIKIEIVIPIYNGFTYLNTLIDQLLSHKKAQYKLILIDDASTDLEVRLLLDKLEKINNVHEIIVKRNSVNLGFVKSANLGMSLTTNHFILLNTDTEVSERFGNALINPILQNNKIASVTPFTNCGTICSFPNFILDNEIFLNLDVAKIDNSFAKLNPCINQEIPTGVGFCMAVNFKAYKEIGGFDEETFSRGYGEENDWCMRARGNGYIHIQAINSFVYHKHGGSFLNVDKEKLLAMNTKKLSKKYPKYLEQIYKYSNEDPLKDIRNFQILNIICDNYICDCFISSVNTGGSANYIKQQVKQKLAFKKAILIISSIDIEDYANIEMYVNNLEYKFRIKDAFTLLEKLRINDLIINHLLFETNLNRTINEIIKFKPQISGHLITVIHDYFSVCPTVTLLDYKDSYCGVPDDLTKCNSCLNNFTNKNINFSYVKLYQQGINGVINNWRNLFIKLFNSSDKIILPSNDSYDVFKCAYPNYDNKVEVIEHDLNYLVQGFIKLNYKPFTNSVIKVAAIGNIVPHKGAKIIEEMVKLAKLEDLNIKWYILGEFSGAKSNNLKVYKYNNLEELVRLINKHQIDICIIPSIWPETFCYTASEVMALNLPLVTFNLGAQVSRVGAYTNGYLVGQLTSQGMLEQIISLIKQHSPNTYK